MIVKNSLRFSSRLYMAEEEGADGGGGGSAVDAVAPADITPAEDQGLTGEVPTTNAPDNKSTEYDWETVIPEDLREKEHFKNILKAENPGAEMVKQLQNAQELIGKKTIASIPGDDATEEERDAFFDKLRPEEPDKYEIPDIDLGEDKADLAKAVNALRTPESEAVARKAFHDAKLAPWQAKIISEQWQKGNAEHFETTLKEAREIETKANSMFTEMATKEFGGKHDEALQYGQKLLEKALTEDERALLRALPEEKLPNEALMVIARLGKWVNNNYEKGDDFKQAPSDNVGRGDMASVDAEMNRLQASEAYLDGFHVDNAATVQKVTALAKQKAALLKQR